MWLWDQQQCVLYVLRVERIARAHVRTAISYLSNCWKRCTEIWCVVSHALDMGYTQVREYLDERSAVVHPLKHIY